ncbi:uncharacterized protein ACRADG_011001 isoform 2-T2 [Cochliomyia hominivorax]
MSSTLSKIHVTNSTGLSLNERFTAISSQPKVVTNIGSGRRSRSRSRSVQRQVPVAANAAADHATTRANQRLLAQLQRKHKMQAALKLKRRSMRTVGGGSNNNGNGRIRRGSVKAFRVGANGKPIRTNSLARIATMKADKETLNIRNRPLRRSNSSGNLANRLGPRRPTVGGAAQRVAKRNLERQRRGGAINGRGRSAGINNRGRSRSRSRTRTLSDNGRNQRSRSRNRNGNEGNNSQNVRRGRSRSRSRSGRGSAGNVNKSSLPVKARLGVRPGLTANRGNNRRRNASLTRRGVQLGRVQKRRNSTNVNAAAGSDNNGRGRKRSRSAVRQNIQNGNVRSRSRSRTRKGQMGQQGTGQVRQQRNNRAPRGRTQQRRGNNNNNGQRRGITNNNNGKAQTQQRRGRSRSRTRRGSNAGNSRNQAKF